MDGRNELYRHFTEHGYAIVRGLFSLTELEEIGAAVDAVRAEALAIGRSFRFGNLHYRFDGGELRMAQWPSYHNAILDAVRTDPRLGALLAPLLGGDLVQIINQLHWKRPGGAGDFAWHQDARFRKPDSAYRRLGQSYVQTGLAIDPHDEPSGGLMIVPGSHLAGPLDMAIDGEVMRAAASDDALRALGIDPATVIHLDLAPGDLALWSPYLLHASGTNHSQHQRRFYINGYASATDCDRGEWAFRGGQPQPLPKPALVHNEELRERPGPHFPD